MSVLMDTVSAHSLNLAICSLMGWYVCTEAQMLPVCLFSLIIHRDAQERTSNFCTMSLMASLDRVQSTYWQNGQVDFLEKRKGMLRVYHPSLYSLNMYSAIVRWPVWENIEKDRFEAFVFFVWNISYNYIEESVYSMPP